MHKSGVDFSFCISFSLKETMISAPKPRASIQNEQRFSSKINGQRFQSFCMIAPDHPLLIRSSGTKAAESIRRRTGTAQRRVTSFSARMIHAGGLADADRGNRCPCIARRATSCLEPGSKLAIQSSNPCSVVVQCSIYCRLDRSLQSR